MALATRADLLTLDMGRLGAPFVIVTKGAAEDRPDIGFLGAPVFTAPSPATVVAVLTTRLFVVSV